MQTDTVSGTSMPFLLAAYEEELHGDGKDEQRECNGRLELDRIEPSDSAMEIVESLNSSRRSFGNSLSSSSSSSSSIAVNRTAAAVGSDPKFPITQRENGMIILSLS